MPMKKEVTISCIHLNNEEILNKSPDINMETRFSQELEVFRVT
jgi:hypothetical protein